MYRLRIDPISHDVLPTVSSIAKNRLVLSTISCGALLDSNVLMAKRHVLYVEWVLHVYWTLSWMKLPLCSDSKQMKTRQTWPLWRSFSMIVLSSCVNRSRITTMKNVGPACESRTSLSLSREKQKCVSRGHFDRILCNVSGEPQTAISHLWDMAVNYSETGRDKNNTKFKSFHDEKWIVVVQ